MADTTTSRMFARAALRAKNAALRGPAIAQSINPALGEIENATGMAAGTLMPGMVGNLNYRSGIASQGMTDQADYMDTMRTAVPEYTNAKYAYLEEKRKKAAADAMALAEAGNPMANFDINDYLPIANQSVPNLDVRFAYPQFAPIPKAMSNLKTMYPGFYTLPGMRK